MCGGVNRQLHDSLTSLHITHIKSKGERYRLDVPKMFFNTSYTELTSIENNINQ